MKFTEEEEFEEVNRNYEIEDVIKQEAGKKTKKDMKLVGVKVEDAENWIKWKN